MNELAKVFSNFLGRDLVYIFSGMILLLVACRIFPPACEVPQLQTLDGSPIWIAFAAGVAYATALAVQELSCIFRITSTALEDEPCAFTQWLFERYQHRRWNPIKDKKDNNGTFDAFEAERRIDRCKCERVVATYERLIALMQVGTTLGPSLFLSGLVLLVWILMCRPAWTNGDAAAIVATLALGSFFLVFGWLKRAQAREFANWLANQPMPPVK
jgi:hypothetical protein